jgi:hypothetical protein
MTATTRAIRPCWRCQNPFGPPLVNHKADLVNWLRPTCALAVTRPTRPAARGRR